MSSSQTVTFSPPPPQKNNSNFHLLTKQISSLFEPPFNTLQSLNQLITNQVNFLLAVLAGNVNKFDLLLVYKPKQPVSYSGVSTKEVELKSSVLITDWLKIRR